jgi:hypothetical protein
LQTWQTKSKQKITKNLSKELKICYSQSNLLKKKKKKIRAEKAPSK